jgi:hypothetical protein
LKRTPLHLLALLLMLSVALFVAACGGSDETTTTAAVETTTDEGTGTVIGGGEADCNEGTFVKLAEEFAQAQGSEGTLAADGYGCADGWAYAFVDVGPEGEQITETALFQAEGAFWVPQDRAAVCGSSADDSDVPAQIYEMGCQTN